MFGVALLWLAAGLAALWWTLAVFSLYRPEWAVLTSLVVLIPLLFVAHVLQRAWRWLWIWSNGCAPVEPEFSGAPDHRQTWWLGPADPKETHRG